METMETINKTVWDVIEEHKESASLSSRFVGCAPTYEWTGEATVELRLSLLALDHPFTHFRSDVKGQPLFGKLCVCFVTFGKPPE